MAGQHEQPVSQLTFDELCLLDGRLRELERDVSEFAAVYGRLAKRCANAAWYGYGSFFGRGFKPRVSKLVGWEREPPGYVEPVLPELPFVVLFNDPILDERQELLNGAYDRAVEALGESAAEGEEVLASSAAYDVAYSHLYAMLPDCSGCGCY